MESSNRSARLSRVGNGIRSFVISRWRNIQVILDNRPINKMLGDNSLGADEIDCAVPDVVGIHDDHWPMAALIHAAGVVHPNDVA